MVIGLTGGIGSGKSTVSEYLMSRGFPVADADDISRKVVRPGSPALAELAEALGPEILKEDGTLDRGYTADLVFDDEAKRRAMEKIMWKAIGESIDREIEAYRQEGHKVIFVDAPLLFEAGLEKQMDQVWVVHADDDLRLQRVMERDGADAASVRARMSSQFSEQQRLDLADVILDNNGTRAELLAQVEEQIEALS